ncbi:MAG: tRNA (N6-threonylcarbamoyladenosine(37)-N6)-methyltransferase TrmO [Thermodesulfobacteriota bacterium]
MNSLFGRCRKDVRPHSKRGRTRCETFSRAWVAAQIIGLLAIVMGTEGFARAEAPVFSMHPVGRVVVSDTTTRIDILPEFRDALLGLEKFSHIIVLYWFDRNDSPEKRSILRVHPRGDSRNPLSGVFATRSPVRPNLIGLSVCRVLSVDKTSISIERIDAFDNTPVVDIKPYIPATDSVPGASVPAWRKNAPPR